MNTPVYDFIKNYAEKDFIRLHVPGHKGKSGELAEELDITEINGADVLYHETGILEESQKNASALFGTAATLYSAEGSSLCIRAMLALIKMYAEKNGKKPLIAAGRNAHKVFMTASALLDIEVSWISPYTETPLMCSNISATYLRAFLENCAQKPIAVYITSPDYLGNMADIQGIGEVCRAYGVLLAVDNAHGAYLNFLPENIHPINLGADICCDSAHKTLPVLTGGAYLHISKNAPKYLVSNAKKAMSLFASTSPSYLILASLDKANGILSDDYRKELSVFTEKVRFLKMKLLEKGIIFIGDEPLKLTLCTKALGYYGYQIAEILRKNGIECEFTDPDFVVMMFTPFNSDEALNLIMGIFMLLPIKAPILDSFPVLKPLEQKMSVRSALFAPSRFVDTESALEKILADACVACPPAIPVAVCGEVLDETAIECFKYYGIEKINVVDIEVE